MKLFGLQIYIRRFQYVVLNINSFLIRNFEKRAGKEKC